MTNRLLWLGIGIGLIVTSLVLGLTSGQPSEETTDIDITEDELRDWAEANDFVVITAKEWDELQKQLKQKNSEAEASEDKRDERKLFIYIPKGFSWVETAQVLEKAEIIESRGSFLKEIKRAKGKLILRPGLYTFTSEEDMKAVIAKLSSNATAP